MAEKDFTTEGGRERPTFQEIQKLMDNLRVIRATADLLCMAADTEAQGRQEFLKHTLSEIGEHLEELATEALVILRYEGPRSAPEPQASRPEDWELDPTTKENILKDLENLQDMGSKIQLAAECMCCDLGLEFPPNIKERIAKEHAAPAADVQGGAA